MAVNLLINKTWKKQKKQVVIKLTLLIISTTVINCNHVNNCSQNDIYNYISSFEFENYEQGDFSQNSIYEIVIVADNGKYYSLPINILYPLYRDIYYKDNLDFDDFVCSILSNKVSLKSTDISDISDVQELKFINEIKLEIEQNGLFNVTEKYGIAKGTKESYIMSPSSLNDIFKYEFYKQGYLFAYDDFDGKYIFVKTEKLLEIGNK